MQSEDSSDDRPERKIEWTLAIVLVSALLGLSFFACINWKLKWKRKSDRAACIMNIRNVQQGVRSWANMNNLNPGDSPIKWAEIIGPGGFITTTPTCPTGGTYRFQEMNPHVGVLAMECSLCDTPENHKPDSFTDW